MRTWDAVKISEAIKFFLKDRASLIDPIEWLSDPTHIVLENEYEDLALFEYGIIAHKVYSGHYVLKSRGRKAINVGKAFLDELFNTCYNIDILMGLTPVENRAARWINRQVGFKSYGIETTSGGPSELFIITKKEFNNG